MINEFNNFCDDAYTVFQRELKDAGIEQTTYSEDPVPAKAEQLTVELAGGLGIACDPDVLKAAMKHLVNGIREKTSTPLFYRLAPSGSKPGTPLISCTIHGNDQPRASFRATYQDTNETLRIECAFAEAA